MAYLYETHMHTRFGSACGVSTGAEHARFYKEKGYTGIIITEHFFRGNTAVNRELPWEERIDLFWRGYEDAKAEGDRIGLDVFFGLEQNFAGDEYLVYGLTKEFMMNRPDMEHWTRRQQLDEVHKVGGCVIQAHPFRMRQYMHRIHVGDLFADGIEAANAGNDAMDDGRAFRYGTEKGLVMTAGSDNHHSPCPEEKLYGVWLEKKLTCIKDYVKIVTNKGSIQLHVPQERLQAGIGPLPDERHRAWILNEAEEDVWSDKQWNTEA